ncbi:hypothetical protein D3C87_1840720 [compost metagenome]
MEQTVADTLMCYCVALQKHITRVSSQYANGDGQLIESYQSTPLVRRSDFGNIEGRYIGRHPYAHPSEYPEYNQNCISAG